MMNSIQNSSSGYPAILILRLQKVGTIFDTFIRKILMTNIIKKLLNVFINLLNLCHVFLNKSQFMNMNTKIRIKMIFHVKAVLNAWKTFILTEKIFCAFCHGSAYMGTFFGIGINNNNIII